MNKLEFVSPGLVSPETLTRSNSSNQVNRSGDRAGDNNRVQAVDAEQLGEAVDRLNENSQLVQRELDFKVNEESGRITVTVRDAQTDEVIRQIPPEKLIAMSESLEEIRGLLFEAEA